MGNKEMIEKATSLSHRKKDGEFEAGSVACVLLTDKNNIYTGVCIDTSSSMGFCAEHNAIGSMISNKEYKIKKIVAVWTDKKTGEAYIFSPCGRCREFMYQINNKNLNTEVILDKNKIVKLKELLPYSGWSKKQKL
jgi:cytidine deaminase